MTEPIFTPGAVLQSRYRLDEALALGGMAEVWRGHDLVLQRAVAIKLLHPHLATDPALVERFRREAISAARLSHPHIVPTYDAGTDGETAYIILGLIHGPTLAETLQSRTLNPAQALSIARQIADALDHAHTSGLIHRDIKPSNILVVGDDYRIMVADFGIAKAVADTTDESLTLPGLVIGTPAYLAPEQASGRDADARSDIYATGVLLHEMLCGHTSVDLPTQLEVDPPTSWEPFSCEKLPAGLQDIVTKATHPDPDERFQSASELCAGLFAEEKRASEAAETGQPARLAIQPPRPPRIHSHATPRWTSDEDTNEHQAIRLAPDSTSVNTEARSTPPAQAVATPHTRRSSAARRSRWLTVALVVILLAAAIAFGLAFRFMGKSERPNSPAPLADPALSAIKSFDPPPGDGSESERTTANAIDGNPATSWASEGYETRALGGLKPGVGLITQLNTPAKLNKLLIESGSSGWAAAIYVSDSPKDSLAAWGSPIDQQSGLASSTTFDLHGTTGGAILVWITDVGTSKKMTVSEMRLTS